MLSDIVLYTYIYIFVYPVFNMCFEYPELLLLFLMTCTLSLYLVLNIRPVSCILLDSLGNLFDKCLFSHIYVCEHGLNVLMSILSNHCSDNQKSQFLIPLSSEAITGLTRCYVR
jgi:hypothetical protein